MNTVKTTTPFKGIRYAMSLAIEQLTDIFGHDNTISVENSEIITNDKDRAKVSKAINIMIETQMENARNNIIKELKEDVVLENGEAITVRL